MIISYKYCYEQNVGLCEMILDSYIKPRRPSYLVKHLQRPFYHDKYMGENWNQSIQILHKIYFKQSINLAVSK